MLLWLLFIQDLDGMTTVVLEVPNESQLRRLSSRLEEAEVQHKLWVEQPEDYPTCLATRYSVCSISVEKRLFGGKISA